MSNPSALGPLRSRNLPNTASPVGNRWAGDVVAHMGVELLATDAVVMGSTSTITGSLTTAQVGDVIFFTSGTLNKTQYSISEVSGTTITVAQDMTVAPTGGDTYNIYRFRPIVLNSSGSITVDTELPAAAALTDGESASTAVPEVGARMMGFNGSTWDRAQLATVEASQTYNTGITASNKGVDVNARNAQLWASSHADNSGAGADDKYYAQNQDPNGNLLSCLSSIRGKLLRFRDQVGTTISGTNPPPIVTGGYGNSSAPTAVTSGRAVDRWHDLNGRAAVFADAAAFADGAIATLGLKADAKSTATDTTAVTIMQVLKQMSYMLQNPAVVAASDNFDAVLTKADKHIHIAFTASQTGATILTPTSGKKFVVTDYDISFSSSGAGTLTIFDNTNSSSTILTVINGANNGGVSHAMRKPYKPSAVNNVWKYTTGAGAAGDITLHGYEE